MTINQVKEIISKDKKGTFRTACWQKECKLKKAYKADNSVYKISVGTVRLGVTYDNISNVQEKRENGELPEKNQGLPWGEWYEFPYIIKYKNDFYLRLSLVKDNPIKSKYYINGTDTDYNSIENMLLASEKKSDKSVDVITVKIDNIQHL